jgi:rubrerythrin
MAVKEKIESMMMKCRCVQCGYIWIPRMNPKDIKACPKCKRYDWRKKR